MKNYFDEANKENQDVQNVMKICPCTSLVNRQRFDNVMAGPKETVVSLYPKLFHFTFSVAGLSEKPQVT